MNSHDLQPDFDAAPKGETIRVTARDGHVLDAYTNLH